MWRRLMCWMLRAELAPGVAWNDIETKRVEARVFTEEPRLFGRAQKLEQVLCTSADEYVLFKKWHCSGWLMRLSFSRSLEGREMRITEWLPGPPAAYRLQLWPSGTAPVTCAVARRTWFGLWRNEDPVSVGPSVCFIDSPDRALLVELRSKLLCGNVPETLRNEEEMWLRMNRMSGSDRRAAMAALAMQALGEVDRQFDQAYPTIGPPPDELKPVLEHVQRQVDEIKKSAAGLTDPELEVMMKRFVADAAHKAAPEQAEPQPE